MMPREQGNLESDMKGVSKELLDHESRAVPDDHQQQQQQQRKQRPVEVREGGKSPATSAAASDYDSVSVEQYKRQVSVVDDRQHGSPVSGEGSVVVEHAVEPRSAWESSSAPISTEEAVVASTGRKRSKRLWKKNRGKQKANKDANEPEVELLSIRVEEPPPAPLTTTITTIPPTSAAPQESRKKPEKEDDHASGNAVEVEMDLRADSTLVDDHSGSQLTGENDPMKDILDFEDEQKYEVEIESGLAAASSRPTLEWGLCGEDDRGPPRRTPPRTPPLREPRVKNQGQGQGQGQGREQPPSPGGHQLNHSPREPWKRKTSESRVRHDPSRSSSIAQLQSPAVNIIEAPNLEGLSEWNRIKATKAAEVASHKNWVPRKGIQRSGEGVVHSNKGRGKAKQGRCEQNLQHSHAHIKELARLKFEADLRIKQEELLQRSKLSLKAEFQKAKRIEASRKGRDELEVELEQNLVYCDDDLIYLNK